MGRPNHKALDKEKVKKIIEIYQKDKTKGRRRIMMELERKHKLHMSLGSVHHYMKILGIKAIVRKNKRKKSKEAIAKEKSLYTYKNVLNRDFKASHPNQKWVTDITYMHSKDGIEYLSTIKDLYDNSIVSYFISNKNDNNLVLETLKRALKTIDYNSKEIIIHSDQGHQYTSKQYYELLNKHHLIGSHSRKGNPRDNACIESFFSTFKEECLKPNKGRTKKTTRELTKVWIKYYNEERPQMNLKKMTPIEYRNQFS